MLRGRGTVTGASPFSLRSLFKILKKELALKPTPCYRLHMDAEMREFCLWLQKECKKQTEHYVRLAEKKLGVQMPMPEIRFNDLGTTAGRAWYGKNLIEYCPRILRLNHEDFLITTTGHEVAHLVAHQLHKNKEIDPHGSEWARVMWAFSLPAIRCHNYDTGLDAPKKRVEPYNTHDGKRVVEKRGAKIITFE